jgi:hypothetical protein
LLPDDLYSRKTRPLAEIVWLKKMSKIFKKL